MTNEELNARFAAVAELLSDFAGEHDITLKRLEEGIDELRNEQRRGASNLDELRNIVREGIDELRNEQRRGANNLTNSLDELRSIVRTAVRAGVRERRERHQAEKELRAQLLELSQRRIQTETLLAEIESRNEQRLSRMEAAIERLAELMARKNGGGD